MVLQNAISIIKLLKTNTIDCNIDDSLYMPAKRLRDCIKSLGGTGLSQIQYIETDDEKRDFLDKICNASLPGSSYDQVRTEDQPDVCTGKYMHTDYCLHDLLVYIGFYCTGMYFGIFHRTEPT